MAKTTTRYVCQSCGASQPKWSGQCSACHTWDTLVEETAEATPKGLAPGKGRALEFTSLAASLTDTPRRVTSIGELDRVLGGGLVDGSATLVGGDPGIGKSTLLLQCVDALARTGAKCVYISGEESITQIQLRAARLGLSDSPVQLCAATSVRDILSTLDRAGAADVVIIDSIQTMFVDTLDAAPGTVSQVRAASHELIRMAKRRGPALILVGHVTKDGQIAGPRVLEHMVDTVLYFEGDRGHPFRILRTVKNRFGGTDEIGVFEMSDRGLSEVSNPSALFLAAHEEPVSGTAVFAGIEGSRPFLVEIQALVAPTFQATPRRAVIGWDSGRLAMLIAVLETRCGLRLSDKEVYLNVAGGFRITEPAADMAVAAAILSALSDDPLPDGSVFFGEVGLSGEVRPVGRGDTRLKEAAKLGFQQAYYPAGMKLHGETALKRRPQKHVRELVGALMGAQASAQRSKSQSESA